MNLADVIREQVLSQQSAQAMMGTVTDVSTTAGTFSASVDLGTGVAITGIRWLVPFAASTVAPAVGDFVVIQRIGNGWWIVGKNSLNLASPNTVSTTVLTVSPSRTAYANNLSGWSWSPDYPMSQGKNGAGAALGGMALMPALKIPSGATVTVAKLQMVRQKDIGDGSSGPASIQPAIYRSTNTAFPTGSTAPTSATYGAVWRPGSISLGKTGRWDLPSSWLADLISGACRSFVVYSSSAADLANFGANSCQLSITYTTPAGT